MLETIRPFLESASFLATIAIFAVSVLALKQVRLLKTDIKLRTERAAKEKAIEASQLYLNSYTQLSAIFTDACQEKKIGGWKGGVGDFSSKSVRESPYREIANKRFNESNWLPAINMLESIASTFVTGVADEQTGLQIIGRTYCGTLEHNYDVISFARSHSVNSYYPSIVTLYQVWSPRLTREEIDESKRVLEERASKIAKTKIPSLGAKDLGA